MAETGSLVQLPPDGGRNIILTATAKPDINSDRTGSWTPVDFKLSYDPAKIAGDLNDWVTTHQDYLHKFDDMFADPLPGILPGEEKYFPGAGDARSGLDSLTHDAKQIQMRDLLIKFIDDREEKKNIPVYTLFTMLDSLNPKIADFLKSDMMKCLSPRIIHSINRSMYDIQSIPKMELFMQNLDKIPPNIIDNEDKNKIAVHLKYQLPIIMGKSIGLGEIPPGDVEGHIRKISHSSLIPDNDAFSSSMLELMEKNKMDTGSALNIFIYGRLSEQIDEKISTALSIPEISAKTADVRRIITDLKTNGYPPELFEPLRNIFDNRLIQKIGELYMSARQSGSETQVFQLIWDCCLTNSDQVGKSFLMGLFNEMDFRIYRNPVSPPQTDYNFFRDFARYCAPDRQKSEKAATLIQNTINSYQDNNLPQIYAKSLYQAQMALDILQNQP